MMLIGVYRKATKDLPFTIGGTIEITLDDFLGLFQPNMEGILTVIDQKQFDKEYYLLIIDLQHVTITMPRANYATVLKLCEVPGLAVIYNIR